jgi:hypothetical protein
MVKRENTTLKKIASLSNNNKIVETEPKRIPSHTHIYIYMNVHSSGLAAFDMVNHTILLSKLKVYKLDDLSLNWFKSYLSERSQKVIINN